MSNFSEWLGRSQTTSDTVTLGGVKRYCATLGIDASVAIESGIAPLGYHWCLCLPDNPMSEIGVDGHPQKGGFLPPVELPRRMWAASDVEFISGLPIGSTISRVSNIANVKEKTGSTGKLVFVEVDHETQLDGECAIKERQTIVYREAATEVTLLPDAMAEPPTDWAVVQKILPTPAMLFRYSALTFNSHRIHYDLPYAKEQEMYPELVVHGPLMASLVLQLAGSHAPVKALSYRGKSPAFCNQSLFLVANFNDGAGELATIGADGRECLTAKVSF